MKSLQKLKHERNFLSPISDYVLDGVPFPAILLLFLVCLKNLGHFFYQVKIKQIKSCKNETKETYNKTNQYKTQCPSQSSTSNANCYNFKKSKNKLKMHNAFLNLKAVIIIRKRRKKRIIDHQVIKKFEKV